MQGLLIEAYSPRLGRTRSPGDALADSPCRHIADQKLNYYIRGKSMEAAARAAARVVPTDDRLVAALMKEASGEDPAGIFREAVSGLGQMGAAAITARPLLLQLTKEKTGEIQYLAFTSLGRILLDASNGIDFTPKAGDMAAAPDERSAGQIQLRLAGEQKRLSPESAATARRGMLAILQRNVKDADTHSAIETLARIGAGSDPAMIQAIFANATDYFGSNAMMAVDFSNDAQVPVLVKLLRTAMSVQTDWVMRTALANGLAHYGSKGRDIAPDLIATLEKDLTAANPDWLTSESYLHLLAALGADVPDVSPAFIRLLDRVPPKNRDSLLIAFFDAGLPTDAAARKVVCWARMIRELNGDEFATLRGRLINKIPSEDLQPYAETFVPKLKAVLTRAEPADAEALNAQLDENREAVRALGHLGPAAVSAKPLLQDIAARAMSPAMYSMTEMKPQRPHKPGPRSPESSPVHPLIIPLADRPPDH